MYKPDEFCFFTLVKRRLYIICKCWKIQCMTKWVGVVNVTFWRIQNLKNGRINVSTIENTWSGILIVNYVKTIERRFYFQCRIFNWYTQRNIRCKEYQYCWGESVVRNCMYNPDRISNYSTCVYKVSSFNLHIIYSNMNWRNCGRRNKEMIIRQCKVPLLSAVASSS